MSAAAPTPDELRAARVARNKTKAEPKSEGKMPPPRIDLKEYRKELRQITETRMPTGFSTLDRATKGGISGNQVVLLTGKSGSLKTVVAKQLAGDRAKKHGGLVYVYAADQGGGQYLDRIAETIGDIVEDDEAFERFEAEADTFYIVDERQDGVTVESFRDLVLKAGNVAAVVLDTPQTVETEDDLDERPKLQKTMSITRDLAGLIVPVFVCSHANRASTAARNKMDRTSPDSAPLGDASMQHRAQVSLFMEKRERQDGITEVDVTVTKASISNLRFRLVLDAEAWRAREIDLAVAEAEHEEKAERTRRERDEAKRTARWDQVRSIIRSKLMRPVAHAVLKDEWKGAMNDLPRTLAAMVEAGVLVETPGEPPKGGGHPPKLYDLA